jgi:hypothetical protein
MWSHISIHGATTKSCDNPFVFKNVIEKEGLPRDIALALGAGGPEFKSRRPDQNISRVFFSLLKATFTSPPICGILAGRRSKFASRLSPKSSLHDEICKNTRRQECHSETIERKQVKSTTTGKCGENWGDPAHFSPH